MNTRTLAASVIFLLILVFSIPAAAGPAFEYTDADRDGRDSPGDQLVLHNDLLTLTFRFANLGSNRARIAPRHNGWFLFSLSYRGENFFLHPDPATNPQNYPGLIANDVVGMTAFVHFGAFFAEPFLWMWNFSKEPRRTDFWARFSLNPDAESWEYYTLYERHAGTGGELTFSSDKLGGIAQTLVFTLDGPRLIVRYIAKNLGSRPAKLSGIIALPMNRIIDNVFLPADLKIARDLAPTASSDNYTAALTATNGLPGSGMLFWARGKNSLLHMDGIMSWHGFNLAAGEQTTRAMTVAFSDQNLDDFYRDYLARNHIAFDTVDWTAAEKSLVDATPRVIMPEGYIYHTYNYNPPGTNKDWHNEMTGRALVIEGLATADPRWLAWTTSANAYYLDRMYFTNPGHVCYGLFRDQTWADKLVDCYPWSQPYNVESLIAEYAVTKDERLKAVLLTHFERMYAGPIWNEAGRRWYWHLPGAGSPEDFGVFDSLEFGADDMISAYEFTGDRKYLDRAVEVVKLNQRALDNFGLLLEDRAGEPSVNTSVFAVKVLFKLYDYTGDEYWRERAVRLLNATLYSRVYMEAWTDPADTWLNGALSRKDGDWRGQWGEPTTGTDSSVPSQTSFIPWVMEALVAGYSHTGDKMYLDYMGQLMHHQLEANRRLSDLTGGRAFACGHYNMYAQKFKDDNDGLTVVGNLFIFPYLKAWAAGVRSPQSAAVLLPGSDAKSVRVFHLSGRAEVVKLILGPGLAVRSIIEIEKDGKAVGPVEFKNENGAATFAATPYRMYRVDL